MNEIRTKLLILADDLTGKPTCGIAAASADLPILFQLSLTPQPDIRIDDPPMGQKDQLHLRPVCVIGFVLCAAIKLRPEVPAELRYSGDHLNAVTLKVIIYIGVGFHIDGIFQYGRQLGRRPVTAVQGLNLFIKQAIQQCSER